MEEMKKNVLIAILMMASLLQGCVKTEYAPTPDKEVTFAVGCYATQTKAGPESMLDVDGGVESFSSMGYLHAEGYESISQPLFGSAGETVKWDETNELWAPEHTYYWPKSPNSYVNFVSWYDKNGAPGTVSETSLVWTIDGSTRSLAADDNIMFADEVWHYKQNNSPATYGFDNVTEGVPTLFHHALAKMQFRIRATEGSLDGNVSITVKDFVVENIYKTGTLSLTNSDPANDATPVTGPTTKAWSNTWAVGSSVDTLKGYPTSVALTEAYQPLTPLRAVIPQGVTNILVKFNYDITTSIDANNSISETVPVSVNLSSFTANPLTWNKIYTFSITINPALVEIQVDPSGISNWVENAMQKITVNE